MKITTSEYHDNVIVENYYGKHIAILPLSDFENEEDINKQVRRIKRAATKQYGKLTGYLVIKQRGKVGIMAW